MKRKHPLLVGIACGVLFGLVLSELVVIALARDFSHVWGDPAPVARPSPCVEDALARQRRARAVQAELVSSLTGLAEEIGFEITISERNEMNNALWVMNELVFQSLVTACIEQDHGGRDG